MGRARMSIVLLVVLVACKLGDPARSGSDSLATTKQPDSIAGRAFGDVVVVGELQPEGVKGSTATTPSAPVASQLDGRSSVASTTAATDNLNGMTSFKTSSSQSRNVQIDDRRSPP